VENHPHGVGEDGLVGCERGEKEAEKGIVPREAVGKANPVVPRPIVHAVLASLMALRAGGKWPAVLARAAPMTPAQDADEDGARAPPRPKGTPAQVRRSVRIGLLLTTPLSSCLWLSSDPCLRARPQS
jgi:hypothetical protein